MEESLIFQPLIAVNLIFALYLIFIIAVLLRFLVFIVSTAIPALSYPLMMFPSMPTHYENHFKTAATMLFLLAIQSKIITAKVIPSPGCISASI